MTMKFAGIAAAVALLATGWTVAPVSFGKAQAATSSTAVDGIVYAKKKKKKKRIVVRDPPDISGM